MRDERREQEKTLKFESNRPRVGDVEGWRRILCPLWLETHSRLVVPKAIRRDCDNTLPLNRNILISAHGRHFLRYAPSQKPRSRGTSRLGIYYVSHDLP